jgi:hypothetical protein
MTIAEPTSIRDYRLRNAVRIAAYLIAFDGKGTARDLRAFMRQHGYRGSLGDKGRTTTGSEAADVLRRAFRELRDEGLARREGPWFIANDVAELAYWLADQLDEDDA